MHKIIIKQKIFKYFNKAIGWSPIGYIQMSVLLMCYYSGITHVNLKLSQWASLQTISLSAKAADDLIVDGYSLY